MPARDGSSCTAAFNSPRCSTSHAGGTTSLLENQRLGATLGKGPGSLAYGVGIPLQGSSYRRCRPTLGQQPHRVSPFPFPGRRRSVGTSVAAPQPPPSATAPVTHPSAASRRPPQISQTTVQFVPNSTQRQCGFHLALGLGEALALTWENLDLEERPLRVEARLSSRKETAS